MKDQATVGASPDAAATSLSAETPASGIDLELALELLHSVIDPEIGLDIVTLGLVYELEAGADGTLRVTHTLTTPGCPMEHVIGYGIETVAMAVPGVTGVERNLVFEPRWHPGMIRDGALGAL